MKKKTNMVTRIFLISNLFYKLGVPILPGTLMRINRVLFSCDIPYSLEIGKGTIFVHNGLGVVIHPDSKIGAYNKIMQNVTIGGKNGEGPPKIGNYCFIGSGACIIGNITIGDDVMIGSNTVVTKSVENGMVIVGNPGKAIKKVNQTLIGIFKE